MPYNPYSTSWQDPMARPDNFADQAIKTLPGGGLIDALGRYAGEGGKWLSNQMFPRGAQGPGTAPPGGDGGLSGALGTGGYTAGGYSVDPSAQGIPGYDAYQQLLGQGAAGAGGRQLSPDVRAGQMGLARGLLAQYQGTGPSLAQGQLQAGTDRNLSQAYALAASQGGGMGAPGAARDVAFQRGAISQGAAQQGAQLRLQEQLGAGNQLGQLYAGVRGQDLDSQALNDKLTQFYLSQGVSLAEAQQQARMAYQQMQGSFNLGAQGINAQAYANQQGRQGSFNSQLFGGMGQGLAYLGQSGVMGGGGAGGVTAADYGGLSEATPMAY